MLVFLPQLRAAVAIPVTEDDVEQRAVDASDTLGRKTKDNYDVCTMGQNRKKESINSHLIIHCPTSEASERANE